MARCSTTRRWSRDTIRSLATLAYSGGRLAKYGRQQLVAALRILDRGDITLGGMTGSWAGAMGQTQFIPTTYNAYAVDFDGDGKRNIWTPIDALASTASYLEHMGWQSGKTWGYEVVLPKGYNTKVDQLALGRCLAEARSHQAGGTGVSPPGRRGDALSAGGDAGASLPAPEKFHGHQALQRLEQLRARGRPACPTSCAAANGFQQAWPASMRRR